MLIIPREGSEDGQAKGHSVADVHTPQKMPCLSKQNIRTHATVFLPTPLKRVSSVLISCAHTCLWALARKPRADAFVSGKAQQAVS